MGSAADEEGISTVVAADVGILGSDHELEILVVEAACQLVVEVASGVHEVDC